MENVEILVEMVRLAERIGRVEQVHLYEGGLVSIEGMEFMLHFQRKEETCGRAQDVCKDHH